MLVKRDFDERLLRPDVEARGRATGTEWISRLKALRRGINARVTCVNDSGPAIQCSVGEYESKLQPEAITDASVPNGQINTFSGSVEEPGVVRPTQFQTSQPHEGSTVRDLTTTPAPGLIRHRQSTTPTAADPLYKRTAKSLLTFSLSLMSPPALSCLVSLIIALIPKLKALFVQNVPGVNMPDAPDGLPPLEWILDIAGFGGGASVPTGLIILGASLSSLGFLRNSSSVIRRTGSRPSMSLPCWVVAKE